MTDESTVSFALETAYRLLDDVVSRLEELEKLATESAAPPNCGARMPTALSVPFACGVPRELVSR